ncbi:MAG: LLM class F420-dependent oxidoreductase [Alphaproteobacteria bacterium]|jgi:probable F420-dependent oxidoreductase|nr:LLM class F420-dependent oxidoreductase [Alphaproteobacteria bacterium]
MKIGYFGFNMGPLGGPEAIETILGAVENCGFESAWTGEHVVAIDPQVPPSPIAPDHHMLDTVAALSFAAAVTSRIKLGSGIILLAQRNPLVLAKELASIDVLSQGRLLAGVGVGYIEGEFEALGIPYGERGARVSEHIEAMRAIWTQDKPVFNGKYTSFQGIQSKPSPVQTPHPPVIIGGMSAPAYRRAVRHGNGWYGFNQDLEAAAGSIAGIKAAAAEIERPAHLGPLSISITPRGVMDKDSIKRYEDLGVERLMLLPKGRGGPTERAVQFIEETAERLGLG